MRPRRKRVFAFVSLLMLAGCGRRSADRESPAANLVSDFVYSSLGLYPVTATASGYHSHGNISLDEKLDDYSESGIARQREFYRSMDARLRALSRESLPPEDRADYDIIQDQVALSLLELDSIQNWRHNPTMYVELIGNALFNPFMLNYAPKETRFRNIIARMGQIPGFLEVAKRNLTNAPQIWSEVAREENAGNIGLIDKTLRAEAPPALKAEYDRAAATALSALRSFQNWLETGLSKRSDGWRLGTDHYSRKLRFALGTVLSPAQLLKEAEAELESTRLRMHEIAQPLYSKLNPGQPDKDLNRVVSAVLGKIAEDHATPHTYMATARSDLDECRRFVREESIVTLPPRDNLRVIETPEFMRGIYGVGGFNSAPPLEPQLGAFYWLTPIPDNWPKERIDSKLREYNRYGLKILTIHEAMPGHYVQLEYANEIHPITRRVLRSVFGNGPYVEGWAVYATEVMLDEGYLNNSPELHLTFLKQQLRMIANAILDVRMQTMNMTDEEAMGLMLDQTFQEKEEATAKLQRAKLSSAQLPTYFVGYREWVKLRREYQKRKGNEFELREFHERALRAGAVPMRALSELLMR